MARQCSRSGCSRRAVATLSYVYADSTAVLGPLATQAEPGTYDLCAQHAASLSAPKGWEVIRLEDADSRLPAPDDDDLMALAQAVRAVGFAEADESEPVPDTLPDSVVELGRRGHLRVIADAEQTRAARHLH